MQVPLGFEICLQGAKLVNDAVTGVFQGILRVVALGGLYSQLETSEEGMLNLVSGKQHFSGRSEVLHESGFPTCGPPSQTLSLLRWGLWCRGQSLAWIPLHPEGTVRICLEHS